MQNWKIKRMFSNEISTWLVAINQMISNYQGKIKLGMCPLCTPCDSCCSRCIWKIMEDVTCCGFQLQLYYNSHQDDTPRDLRIDLRHRKWRTARLSQLKNWKKILKIELSRRDL